MSFAIPALIILYATYHLIRWWDEVRAGRWAMLPPEKRTE